MNENEVLAAGLAHETRVADITVEIRAGLPPKALEGGRTACEMDACEVLALGTNLTDEGAAAGKEVHDSVGQSGLFIQLHQIIVGEQSCC